MQSTDHIAGYWYIAIANPNPAAVGTSLYMISKGNERYNYICSPSSVCGLLAFPLDPIKSYMPDL